jgi:two-component system OmpR family sensor kinase
MKRHAVLLTILFALTVSLVSVSIVFYEFYKLNKKQYIEHMFTKYALITQIYREYEKNPSSSATLDANLAVYNLELVRNQKEFTNVLANATVLKQEVFQTYNKEIFFKSGSFFTKRIIEKVHVIMLEYKAKIYFYIKTPVGKILIKDNKLTPYKIWPLLYTYMSIFFIISLSFFMILQKLRPLILIRRKIERFAKGDMSVTFATSREDEIGLIANALEDARNKIQTMLEARTLFLRNIMHELKTPIAKGRLASAMLKDEKKKKRFESIFLRLEDLVNEFALIEEVNSLADKSEFKQYRLIDIIDGAIDMAMVESENIHVDVPASVKKEANYRLYTTAIKNMIDNGIKYSTDRFVEIVYEENELCFKSKGECIKYPLKYYIEPFTKENPSKNSFGLGLYLVDSILKIHDEVLAHEYKEGKNIFIFAKTNTKLTKKA